MGCGKGANKNALKLKPRRATKCDTEEKAYPTLGRPAEPTQEEDIYAQGTF